MGELERVFQWSPPIDGLSLILKYDQMAKDDQIFEPEKHRDQNK